MAKDFKQGVLVWAKMKGFPPWPAKVAFPTDGKSPKSKKTQRYVYFFGTHNYAWVYKKFIFPHSEEMLASAKSKKKISSSMKTAIQEIENACRKGRKKFKLLTKDKLEEDSASPQPSLTENFPEKPPKKSKKIKVEIEASKVQKTTKVEMENQKKRSAATLKDFDEVKIEAKKEKDVPSNNEDPNVAAIPPDSDDSKPNFSSMNSNGTMSDSPSTSRLIPIKVQRKTTKDEIENHKKRSAAILKNFDEDVNIEAVPSNNGYPNAAAIPPDNDDSKPNISSMNSNGTMSDSPSTSRLFPVNIDTVSPFSIKIGFLGLGVMGCEMVRKLLSTGHNVTIWNKRNEDIYTTFVEMGANTAPHPADVVRDCDLIISCQFNAEAARRVVFRNHGVLAGFDGLCSNKGKGYVEMTSLDPFTSQDIGEAIASKEGRYLEASMIGNRQDIIDNTITILAAGDNSLYNDCHAVFSTWSNNALFLSPEVGFANKISLILQIMAGTTHAALVETISMIVMLFVILELNMRHPSRL